MPAASALPVPRQANRPLIAAGVVLLLLALIALGAFVVRGALTQQAAKPSGGQLVQAPGEGRPGSLVQAPGNSNIGAPVQAPADSNPNKIVQSSAPVVNTADISDYLRFVKEVEDRKMRVIKSELAGALASQASQLGRQAAAASDDDQSKAYLPSVAKDSAQYDVQWNELTKYFNTRVPPASCRDIYVRYYDHLGKIQSQFVKVRNALAQAQSDPSKALQSLTDMQGTASVEADTSARSADDAVDDVCRKYSLRKEFDIKTDPSGSTGSLR